MAGLGLALAQQELVYRGIVKEVNGGSITVYVADYPESHRCDGLVEIVISRPYDLRPGESVEFVTAENPCDYEFVKALRVRRISPEGLEVRGDDI